MTEHDEAQQAHEADDRFDDEQVHDAQHAAADDDATVTPDAPARPERAWAKDLWLSMSRPRDLDPLPRSARA